MTDHDVDRIATAVLCPADPTPAERGAAWEEIVRRVAPAPAPRRVPRRLLAVPVAAAAAMAALALLPSTGEDGTLASASAAEVLRATADGASLPAPGPGQQLYVRERRVIPLGGGATEVELVESWSAADGSGRMERTFDNRSTEVQTFAAGAAGEELGTWRADFTPAGLRALPTQPAALLAALRRVADTGGEEIDVIGLDLAVLAITLELLDRAPIALEQRTALLDLLATAPDWKLPGSSVTPLSVERVGAPAGGEVRIRVESRLTEAEARRLSTGDTGWGLEIALDPARGLLTEIREYEDGLQSPPQVTTVEAQRIVASTG